jgi:hypothetical protein
VDHQPEGHRLTGNGMGRIARDDQSRPRLRPAVLVCVGTVLMLVGVVLIGMMFVHVMLLVPGSAAERGRENGERQ